MPTVKGRSEVRKALAKDMADAFESDGDIEAIPTGALAIDIITGIGGIPRARLTELFGWEGSGKTTLGTTIAATCQASGLYPVYVDVENGIDPLFATKIGFDLDDARGAATKGLYLRPDTVEECARIIHDFAQSNEVDVVLVDSVAAMVPESIMAGKIEETGRIGELARLLSSILPRLTKDIKKSKTALVLCNQMRKTVSTGWTPPGWSSRKENTESSAGGSALRFYSSLRIDLTLRTRGIEKKTESDLFADKSIEVPTANLHTAQAFKNRVGVPYRSCSFLIRYDAARNLWGIDNRQTVIDIAVTRGIIGKKPGGRYSFEQNGLSLQAHGEEALYNELLANPAAFEAIQLAVLDLPEVRTALRL